MMTTARFEIMKHPRCETESVLRLAFAQEIEPWIIHRFDVAIARGGGDDPERTGRIDVVDLGLEEDRFDEGVTESDVDEVAAVEVDEQAQVIEGDAEHGIIRHAVVEHPALEQRDVIAQRREQVGERTVELVAEPSPASVDDLGEDAVEVEFDGPFDVDVEVLERDELEMRAMQQPQRFERSRRSQRGPLQPDPLQVGRDSIG